jgi:glutathione-regulated potassium-efflux system ancillary protein KefG
MRHATRPTFRSPPEPSGHALVLLAHPTMHRSRANAALIEAARGVQGVTVHDLYDCYPDFDIDAEREQALLSAHSLIVLQFPFYWYSAPALVKQWLDLVLEFGWAYGPGGRALAGKTLLCALTTGGGEAAYQPDGVNRFTIPELLRPLEQTAHLCQLRWAEPFVVHGALRDDPGALAEAGRRYADRLRALSAEVSP